MTEEEANEWINKKIEEGDIIYFKYNEFSNITYIDKGSSSKVSRAHLTSKGLDNVALKSFDDTINLNELVKELKLLRKVSYHRNINRFLGLTEDSIGNYVLVLEYADDGNLRDYLKKKFNLLEWRDKNQMALDITCGLKCLHSEEIIHRDLHSKNILVNNGKLLIADLGLSKKIEANTSSMANRMGIVEYIEPQCFNNADYKKDKKSDIYGLGVILWEITSGRPPFSNYQQELLSHHISINKLRETPIRDTPLEYQQLYQKCWDDDPNIRPDIEEVYKILSQLKAAKSPANLAVSQTQTLNIPDISTNANVDSQLHNLNIDHIYSTLDTNNKPEKEREKEKIRNLLIIGRTLSGKSTLSNVLCGSNDFKEDEYTTRKTKKFQKKIFKLDNGMEYRVVDLGVNSIEKNGLYNKMKEVKQFMPEGISQVLFVVDGIKGIGTFGSFIFEKDIIEYTTIVRTKFENFRKKGECEKDKDQLCKGSEIIAKIVGSRRNIIHVDNPPTNIIVGDYDDKGRIRINEKTRAKSREILLTHLEKVCQEKYYKWNN